MARPQVVEFESDDYSTTCCIANCDSEDTMQRVDMNPCNVTITVTQKLEAPVYMYYKMEKYFQNHRSASRASARAAAPALIAGPCRAHSP